MRMPSLQCLIGRHDWHAMLKHPGVRLTLYCPRCSMLRPGYLGGEGCGRIRIEPREFTRCFLCGWEAPIGDVAWVCPIDLNALCELCAETCCSMRGDAVAPEGLLRKVHQANAAHQTRGTR
jgi:hypothetical protein